MQIIGIDPGLRKTGWGIVSVEGNIITHVSNGTLKSSESNDLSQRLLEIFVQLVKVIEDFKPEVAAVENTFINKDAAGALKLGQARAIALLAPAKLKLPVFEYAPNTIKKAVVGVGHADKIQIMSMVRILLKGLNVNSNDEADALAVAICHAHYRGAVNY